MNEPTREQLEAVVAERNHAVEGLTKALDAYEEQVAQLEADCAAMREALKHYANMTRLEPPEDWDYAGSGGGPELPDMVEADIGYEAREALKSTDSGTALLEKAKKADDWLDTLRAIYERLGIKDGEVPGDEKVGVTVKRYIDRVVENADRLAAALEKCWEELRSFGDNPDEPDMTRDLVQEALAAHRKGEKQ